MPKTLVLGIGNSLRGDDGAGELAVTRLSEMLPNDSVEYLWRQQLTPDLADDFSQVDLLVMIDASVLEQPGQIARRDIEPDPNPFSFVDHTTTLAQMLRLTLDVYGRRPQTILFTIGLESAEYWQGLSPIVAQGLPDLIEQVRKFLAEKLGI